MPSLQYYDTYIALTVNIPLVQHLFQLLNINLPIFFIIFDLQAFIVLVRRFILFITIFKAILSFHKQTI